jgi:hypothetical protein
MPIGAVIGAVGAIGGAVISSNAAKKSAKTQAAGAAAAQATQQANLADIKGHLQPYMDAGSQALPQLTQAITGIGNGNSESMMAALANYPGYQFALKQGMQGLNAEAAKQGSRLSGNQLAGAADFLKNSASSLFDKYLGNLSGLTGYGERANTTYAQAATGTANNVSQLQENAANARAQGQSANGQIWSNLASNTLPQLIGGVAGGGGVMGSNASSWLNKPIQSLWQSSAPSVQTSGSYQEAGGFGRG